MNASDLRRKASNRLARLRWWWWRARPYVSAERPIVVGGSPRSGTTLLRRMLDAQPRIVCGPESSILLPGRPPVEILEWGYAIPAGQIRALLRDTGSQAAFIEAFFQAHCERVGKPRWSEKTPLNAWHMAWVWRHFPEARFVHVIRDGRDVVCSMRRHVTRRLERGRMVEVPPPSEPLHRTVQRWVTHTGKGLRSRDDPRYTEVRYEDLVAAPTDVLDRLLGWLGEPFAPDVVAARAEGESPIRRGEEWDAAAGIERSSVGRWRRDLSAEEVGIFKRYGNARLVELGYVDSDDW